MACHSLQQRIISEERRVQSQSSESEFTVRLSVLARSTMKQHYKYELNEQV